MRRGVEHKLQSENVLGASLDMLPFPFHLHLLQPQELLLEMSDLLLELFFLRLFSQQPEILKPF